MLFNFWKSTKRPLVQAAAAGFAVLLSLPASALEVTGSFSGWWDQPEQQNHGAIIAVSRLPSGEKTAVVYWAHYDDGGAPTWLIAQGEIEGDRIMAQVYEVDGITFMQPRRRDGDFGEVVGTMEIRFSDCLNGRIAFDTETVGDGEFPITRLTDQLGVACSGGISDDFRPDHMPREFVIALEPTAAFGDARGEIEFEMRPGRGDFSVEVENLPEGEYELRVGGEPRGAIEVFANDVGTAGRLRFRSPAVPGTMLLDFEPRDRMIEVLADGEVVLAAATPVQGNAMGQGMAPFQGPDDGRFETQIQLLNDGVYPEGSATARFEMVGPSGHGESNMEFDIEARNIPVGSYPVRVMGLERGLIEVTDIGTGETRGEIQFRFPDVAGTMHLDFDPRSAMIEILEDSTRLFSAEFPEAGSDGGFGMGMGPGHGGGMGPGMGHGPVPGVDFAGIDVELENAGVYPAASAEAEYEQHPMRVVFRIRVENAPTGAYPLLVGGIQRGVIEVISSGQGTHGTIGFSDPPAFTELTLDFDPRGETIEIRRDGQVIFEADFPR